MLGTGIFRCNQKENQIDRPLVDRIKVYRMIEPGKYAKKPVSIFKFGMWQGNALSNTGTAQTLPLEQRIENKLRIDTADFSRAFTQFTQSLFFALCFEVGDNALRIKKLDKLHQFLTFTNFRLPIPPGTYRRGHICCRTSTPQSAGFPFQPPLSASI